MKHLPNELLYLLKVYNYVTQDIGLDCARSHSEDIREYIRNAEFLNEYPTVREYLSEEKSIDDILTYIQRNEKTYSLLGEWKDGEIESLFKSKGIEGNAKDLICGISVKIDGEDAYFTLPGGECREQRIILKDCTLNEDVFIDNILWAELYRSKDGGYSFEIFDGDCNTVKIDFSDFECKKMFFSAAPLINGCKNDFCAVVKTSEFLNEKYRNDSSSFSEGEITLLPVIRFFAFDGEALDRSDLNEIISLFDEYDLKKGVKLLISLSESESEKKKISISKKIKRLLASRKCRPFVKTVLEKMIDTQKDIPEKI